jgi:hypothetical protein
LVGYLAFGSHVLLEEDVPRLEAAPVDGAMRFTPIADLSLTYGRAMSAFEIDPVGFNGHRSLLGT